MKPDKTQEYLRRNMLVAKAAGALAAAQSTARLERETKRPRKWVLRKMQDIAERVEPLIAELAAYRDQIPVPKFSGLSTWAKPLNTK